MFAGLRASLLKTPLLVVLGLVVVWLLFGWYGFGPLAKWGAEKFVAERTGHHLTMETPRFDPIGLELSVANLKLSEPGGQPLAGFKELFVDFEATSLFRWAWTFDAIRIAGPEGRLVLLPEGQLNWSAFLDALKDEEDDEDKKLPRLLIRHFELKDGRFDFADRTLRPAFEFGLTPLDLSLDDLSTLPDDKGAYQISARTLLGGKLRWQGDVELKPLGVTGVFSLEGLQLAQLTPYLKGRVKLAEPEGQAGFTTRYRVVYDKKRLGLNLDSLVATVDGLRLRGLDAAEPALALDRLAIGGGSFDLATRRLNLGEIALAGGRVSLTRRVDGSLDVQDWFPVVAAAAPAPEQARPAWTKPTAEKNPAEARPWRIDLARLSLDGVGIHVLDQTFAKPLALEVGNLHAAFKAAAFKAAARIGDGAPQASLEGGEARLDTLSLRMSGKPVFELGSVVLEGLQADLAARRATAARLALADGDLTAVRGADGRIDLLEMLKPARPAVAAPHQSPPRRSTTGKKAGWAWRLDRAEANDFRVALRDETVKPAAGLTLVDIDASVTGLSENLDAAVPARLALRIKEGGALRMQGKLVPARRTLDAQVSLSGLRLSLAQPYVAQAVDVVVASGVAGSQGRLKVGDRVSYRGGFSVDNLRVNEAATGDRVLAWKRMASDELTASPEAVDIGAIKVDGLGLKLIVHKDKTLNLTRLMKAQAGSPAPLAAAKPAKPGMKFAIERIGIAANELDFADESLALPFGARIHGVKGSIHGIGPAKGPPAQLELDGLVDDYGLARAVGQIDLLDPAGFTDIKVIFRNVEMNRLTPYSATFAGRKIDSGKLSLDLEYKIKARRLEGDNQIVMEKLTLGERVESPTAKNLPLDLAIAILQDSNGVIELGLPVSGSLDDPQFSYGSIVWKAFVSLIGKIVLAPFRALGKLLGIEGDKLEKVSFDLGEARLPPPEQEKLKRLADALAKRPGLALSATPAWNPVGDRRAIKETRLRRALAEAMGRALGPDEEPGPVSLAQPKAQAALEKLYGDRLGAEALKTLKAKHAQANPEPPPTSTAGKLLSRLSSLVKAKPEPLSEQESARLRGANLHDLIHQTLLEKDTVTDAQLVALARERAEAVRQALLANGVAAERIETRTPEAATAAADEVALKLSLGVASKAAMPAAGAAAP